MTKSLCVGTNLYEVSIDMWNRICCVIVLTDTKSSRREEILKLFTLYPKEVKHIKTLDIVC